MGVELRCVSVMCKRAFSHSVRLLLVPARTAPFQCAARPQDFSGRRSKEGQAGVLMIELGVIELYGKRTKEQRRAVCAEIRAACDGLQP